MCRSVSTKDKYGAYVGENRKRGDPLLQEGLRALFTSDDLGQKPDRTSNESAADRACGEGYDSQKQGKAGGLGNLTEGLRLGVGTLQLDVV
jgi:hypothetical protein